MSIQWELKRGLTPYITTDTIDRIYNTARREGAISGKLLGAGGGGFILFFANEKHHIAIKNALSEYMFVPFRFDFTGSQVVYYSQGDF